MQQSLCPETTFVPVKSPQPEPQVAALPTASQQFIAQQLASQQVGLQTPAGFMPVPVSLTPWQLRTTQFAKARQLAVLLGQIQAKAALSPEWLLKLTAGLQTSATVPGQIWRTLQRLYQGNSGIPAAPETALNHNLMLNRHDFLQDQHQQWRWVESNPIAAGMGPLNSRYLAILQQSQPAEDLTFATAADYASNYASNDAIRLQARLLAQAALARAGQPATARQPLMLIVVEAQEDNIFDQQLLCEEVQRCGVRVERVSIPELLHTQIDRQHQLLWQAQQVDLLYWRTGYNPTAELSDAFWQFRARLELAEVTQCPTLAGQLTGSKWFQHQFTALLLGEPQVVAARFALSSSDISLLRQAVLPSFAVAGITPAQAQQLIAQGYWYKTQQEGGGNVARAEAALMKLAAADDADLLMAPIDAQVRREPLYSLRHGKVAVGSGHISELGIFSLGDAAWYGGYLCRTKPAQNNEGGVHRGGAVLDTILLR